MSEFCYIVEKVEWNHHTYDTYDDFETKEWDICRVFKNYEDAKSFVEKDAEANIDYNFKWRSKNRYCGSSTIRDLGLKFEILYKIHRRKLY